MNTNRYNAYRIMWVFVYFDLPTETKKQRKDYSKFRKSIIEDGFGMLQYSIYIRHCNSRENADVHIKRVKRVLPPEGHIIVFTLTDKQFGDMEIFLGKSASHMPNVPQQLELF